MIEVSWQLFAECRVTFPTNEVSLIYSVLPFASGILKENQFVSDSVDDGSLSVGQLDSNRPRL